MTNETPKRRGRRRSRMVAGAVILIAAVVLASLGFVSASRARACTAWHRTLADVTARAAGSVGEGTARQFRLEAIRRGWVDVAGRKVYRPSDCAP